MNAFRLGLALVWLTAALAAAPAEMGVVVVHGKQGAPDRDVSRLAEALRGRGYAVSVPTMPWAGDRIYAASYESGLAQIDGEVGALRARGARLIVIAGHSLGANAALGYAAGHGGLGGLVLLAPGHFPENPLYQQRVASQRARAQRLVAGGQGDRPAAFWDAIQAFMIPVRATPLVFLGYTDPAGPAVMARNAAAIRTPLPLLLIQEANPAVTAEDERIYQAAPFDPRSRYLHSSAAHVRVPDASIAEVLAWLLTLSESAPPHSPPGHQ